MDYGSNEKQFLKFELKFIFLINENAILLN